MFASCTHLLREEASTKTIMTNVSPIAEFSHATGDRRIMWLFNCIGTPTSLLYWNGIFPPYLRRFPKSEILTARAPSQPIPGTKYIVEYAGSIRIPLGTRRNTYPRQLVLASPTILQRIWKRKPDAIVISELLAYSIYVAIFRRLIPSKIIVLVESDPYRQTARRASWLVNSLRRFASRRMDAFLTNNESGQRYLVEQLNVPPEKVMVHPYLVSEIHQSEAPKDLPESIRKDIDDSGKVRFLYVGQLIERKGVLQLMNAVALLPDQLRTRMSLWLVGAGEQSTKIATRIEELGLQESVRLMGKRPYEELPEYYNAADVFVMPTLDDYRALVGFEAISLGLPLLHSKYDGACEELVDEARNGFSFDPLNSQQTAERITWFINNRHKLASMSDASREKSKVFTIKNAVDGIVQAIDNLFDD